MAMSKTEVNLRRLLAAAPNQKNQAKLVHYIITSRELLEQLGAEASTSGISSISKAKMNDYSEKIEAIAARLSSHQPELVEAAEETSLEQIVPVSENNGHLINPASTLRRRTVSVTKVEDSNKDFVERDMDTPVKLDAEAQAHIEKHRKLQDDLTDEMVTLAQQLKESSLVMSKSLNETEKILDSTEKAVEQSLASTGRANARAVEIYSEASKTTCFTWLIIFLMTCIFIMVVLLIRVT